MIHIAKHLLNLLCCLPPSSKYNIRSRKFIHFCIALLSTPKTLRKNVICVLSLLRFNRPIIDKPLVVFAQTLDSDFKRNSGFFPHLSIWKCVLCFATTQNGEFDPECRFIIKALEVVKIFIRKLQHSHDILQI